MTKVTRLSFDKGTGLESRRLHLREISEESATPLDSVGADLRAARLRLGEELDSIAKKLRIRRDHVDAIEEGHTNRLPGKTYAIGFVRSYAEYLGLDANDCVRRFKAEIQGRTDIPDLTFPEVTQDTKVAQGSWIIIVFLAIVGVIGAYYLATSAGNLKAPTTPDVPERLANATAPAPAPVPVVQPKPTTEALVLEAALAAGKIIRPDAPAEGASTTAVPPPAIALPEPQEMSGRVYGQSNRTSRITIVAREDAELRVSGADGRALIARRLRKGDSYRVPSADGVVLSVADGGQFDLRLDDTYIGLAGAPGIAVEGMVLSPDTLAARLGSGQE